MKCKISESETIQNYLQGNLLDTKLSTFNEHLSTCADCFEAIMIEQEVITLIEAEGDKLFKKEFARSKRSPRFSFQSILNRVHRLDGWGDFIYEKNYQAAFLLVATVLLMFIFRSYLLPEADVLASIDFREKVPHIYEPLGHMATRNLDRASEDSLEIFKDNFTKAMFEYKDLNYKKTIENLKGLKKAIKRLERNNSKEARFILAEYYFYLGISYFALLRNEELTQNTSIAKRRWEPAIRSLEVAFEFAQELPELLKSDGDKTTYYLGLANGFAGNAELAIHYLKQVHVASPYFEKAIKLRQFWENKLK